MKHQKSCGCFACEHGLEAFHKMKEENLKKTGFITIPYVSGCEKYPNNSNVVTEGFQETWGHKDLQVCFPSLSWERIHDIFWVIANLVKDGNKFQAGKFYDNIIQNYEVQFVNARQNGRDVLRLLICDPNGKYDTPMYQAQFTMLDDKE